jgi:hypothetical protein
VLPAANMSSASPPARRSAALRTVQARTRHRRCPPRFTLTC